MIGFPKPKPGGRRRAKGRERREEVAVIEHVREHCVTRDGYCRLKREVPSHVCQGPSEWSHLRGHRRSATRGQDPERRHTTTYSMMLCKRAHDWEETGKLLVQYMSSHGADGLIRFRLLL